MTLDEAIKHAEEVADGHDRIKQIKAVTLEECRCAEDHRQLAEWLKDYKRLLEKQDDAIKYCETINKVSQTCGMPYRFVENEAKKAAKALKALQQESCEDAIAELPSVTPQPKMGRWIKGKYKDTCDKCRCTYPKNIGIKNYCPNCGTRMKIEADGGAE